MQRAFLSRPVAHNALRASGISLLAITLLVTFEGLTLHWLGHLRLTGSRGFSVVHFAPPRAGNLGFVMYKWRSDEPGSRIETCLKLHRFPDDEILSGLRWIGRKPYCAAPLGLSGKIAVGHVNGDVYIWDTSSPWQPELLGRNPPGVLILTGLSDRWLVLANDQLLCLWDVELRQRLWERTDLEASCIAYHATTGAIVCGTSKGDVLELNPKTGQTQRLLTHHVNALNCLTVSPDGRRLASVAHDQRLLVTDYRRGRTLWAARHYGSAEVCFSPDSTLLASAGLIDDRWAVFIWDAATGKQQRRMFGHTGAILGLAFTEDNLLCSWGIDGTVRVWCLERGAEVDRYQATPPC